MKLFLLRVLYICWVLVVSLCVGLLLSYVTLLFSHNDLVIMSAFFTGVGLGGWSCLKEVSWKDLGD